jgi:hypothetical protein
MIESHSSTDSSAMFKEFQLSTDSISSLFAKIGKYPDDHFKGLSIVSELLDLLSAAAMLATQG